LANSKSTAGRRSLNPLLPLPGSELLADSLAPRSQDSGSGNASEQLLVQWLPNTDIASRKAIHDELGCTVVSSIHTLAMDQAGEGVLDVVQYPKGSRSRNYLLEAYKQRPEVKFAEFNGSVHSQATSNDPSLGSLWGMQGTGFGSNAVASWANNITGKTTTVVGDIDSGIDYTHPDLYLNIWLNQGEIKNLSFYASLVDTDQDGLITFRDLNDPLNRGNATATQLTDYNNNGYIDAGDLLNNLSGWEDGSDNDLNGYVDDLIGWDFVSNDNDPFDDNSHGTHTAGTIGATGGNGVGVVGVNWQVQIAAMKFLNATGSGSLSNAVLATDYFTAAKIQAGQRGETGQFVGTNNSWGGGGYSQALVDAITRANQNDLLFIAAAGNSSLNIDLTASYPASYTNANLISVAAIASDGTLASYSNYGAVSVDLGAPGSAILSTVPGAAGYASVSGTSMATPHVMGAAALLKSTYANATAVQIKQAILESAAPTASLAGKTMTGGRLDIPAALTRLGVLMNFPVITVVVSDANAAETGPGLTPDPGSFTFTRSGDLTASLTVNYILSGTASTVDYTSSLGTSITFLAGSNNASLTINPVDDTLIEGPETLILTLASSPNYTIGAASTATITIADNDTFPTPLPPTNQTIWGTNRNNTLTGGSGDDRIAGVVQTGTTAAALGRGQIDTLTGGVGKDTFLLADSRGTFYNDGATRSQGLNDYVLITDFNAIDDKLQLANGSQYLYRFANSATEIFLGNGDNILSNADELIGRLQAVNLTPGAGNWIVQATTSWTTWV
jgi:subtilisin family serine protease